MLERLVLIGLLGSGGLGLLVFLGLLSAQYPSVTLYTHDTVDGVSLHTTRTTYSLPSAMCSARKPLCRSRAMGRLHRHAAHYPLYAFSAPSSHAEVPQPHIVHRAHPCTDTIIHLSPVRSVFQLRLPACPHAGAPMPLLVRPLANSRTAAQSNQSPIGPVCVYPLYSLSLSSDSSSVSVLSVC